MKRRGFLHPVRTTSGSNAALWATLTIVAFPIVALSLEWFGFNALSSFALGALASLSVLLIEGIVRGKWWVSDPSISRILDTPELGLRLLVIVGIVMFIFQTLVLTAFMTNPLYDGNVVQLVLSRQCNKPSNAFFAQLCAGALERSGARSVDVVSAAIRDAAEKRLFPGGLVTCAVRPLATQTDVDAIRRGSLVRCDRWVLGRIAEQPVRTETVVRTIMAKTSIQKDGTCRVDGWSDDPGSTEWLAIGGTAATHTTMMADEFSQQPGLGESLAQETFRRVMEKLSKW